MEYDNFTIQADGREKGTFYVQVIESPRGLSAKETVRLTPKHYDLLKTLADSTERRKKSRTEMFKIGAALRNMLLTGDVRNKLIQCRTAAEEHNKGLCLRLVLNDAVVASLPWEYIHLPRSTRGVFGSSAR